jgi:hypothetical protein
VALELARRGIGVTLIEQDAIAVNRSSLRNEGKIHLGFIYAHARSLETAFLQLDAALRFRAIVASWLGPGADWLAPSTPFQYLVARDSVVGPEALSKHYAAVERRCAERLAGNADLDYLGERPARLVRPLADREIAAHFDPATLAAGFATAERAIDTDRLAAHLRQSLGSAPNVRFAASHTAREVREEAGGFRVDGETPDGKWSVHAHQVVNATWERRLKFDRQLGIPPPEHLLHRLKFRLIGRLPGELRGAPSVSMVLGRYGDVVIRSDGTAYLSWYPAGLRGWTHELEPPPDWDSACRGEVDPALSREITTAILTGIEPWYPGIARCEPLLVDAGAIVAIGESDVDDSSSALHERSRIGVHSRGGYHSVDTGKLTTAPLFAVLTADRVEAHRRTRALAS